MSLQSTLQSLATNSEFVGAVVNLAASLTIMLGHFFWLAKLIGISMFILAIWMGWSRDTHKPANLKAIMMLAIMGTILYGLTVFMGYATHSLWPNANPAFPESYLAQAQAQQSAGSFGAALLFATMVIINVFGWFFAIKGAIGLGFAGKKQDVGEAVKKNLFHLLGALLIINIALLAGDVAYTLSGGKSNFTSTAEF